ncbi:helix-turn-helix domain-containing protein [Dysosmobacter sp.]|uniref:helix-turn-helix domain-containing protein n=1 Tax=Dysosmobacter sp. TaxID=2591382 RepID=UPI003AB5E34F
MELKEKLVALRKEKGLTQLAVAERLGVSRQAISRWESGMALPSTDNLKCLGALYGVPVDYLINEATERPVSEGDNKKIEDQQRRKRLLRGIVAIISVILIGAVFFYIVVSFREKKTETIPIEDLQMEKDDSYPSESFSMK